MGTIALLLALGSLYRIISQLADKGAEFEVLDDPAIDTRSRTGKLVMSILAVIAEFENDIRRERQMDGIVRQQEAACDRGNREAERQWNIYSLT
jgi:DNA invertase Pin-like site-specific DNA recombinase